MSAPNQKAIALEMLASQSANRGQYREQITELLSKSRNVHVDDVEALILVAKVKTNVNGKPGFKLVGGVAGEKNQLKAMEILLSEKINAEDGNGSSN